jgi:hypothetical protein
MHGNQQSVRWLLATGDRRMRYRAGGPRKAAPTTRKEHCPLARLSTVVGVRTKTEHRTAIRQWLEANQGRRRGTRRAVADPLGAPRFASRR